MRTRYFALGLVVMLMIASLVDKGYPQVYPTRQVELICSATPGGSNDTVTRAMAEYASKKWGSPVVVINKPGGGTVIATHYALKEAKPDGYTVFSDSHICANFMVAGMVNPPIKLEDRIFIARVVLDPVSFAVKADSPWKTFKELSDWTKVHAKELSWGTTGPFGTSAFGIGEWLTAIGVNPLDTRMVTAGGFAETLPRLLGGHILLICQTVAEVYPYTKAGTIRTLAIAGDKRSPYLPDVPTTTEAGVPGLKGVKWWSGISVAKGTPQFVIDKWAKVTEEMGKDPAFAEKINKLNLTVSYLGPADCKDFVYKEAELNIALAPKLGVRK